MASLVVPVEDQLMIEVIMRNGEVNPFLVQLCRRGEVSNVKEKYPEVERLAEASTTGQTMQKTGSELNSVCVFLLF